MAADADAAQLTHTAGADPADSPDDGATPADDDWATAVFGSDVPEDNSDGTAPNEADGDEVPEVEPTTPDPKRAKRLAIALGGVFAIALAALVGWFGIQADRSHHAQQQRAQFLEVARQGAVNMTTIDWQHADQDIQRILDSATGTFYDDFSKRSKPFIDVVKKAQSKSTGTVTEAAVESESANQAQVLVAVRVNTSNIGAQEQEPRHWRMRMTVDRVGAEMKVSNVVFVP